MHVPYANNYNYPAYALQSMGTVCKRIGLPKIGPGPNDYGPAFNELQGDPNCQLNITNPPLPPDAPTCRISAESPITRGSSTKLSWLSNGLVESAYIDNGIGGVPANGERNNVFPPSTIKYTLTVIGPGGTGTCDVTVTVSGVATNCPPGNWDEPHNFSGPSGPGQRRNWPTANDINQNTLRLTLNQPADPGCSYQMTITTIDGTHGRGEACDPKPKPKCKQRFEQVFVEGYNNDGTRVFGPTALTPDIPDDVEEITETFSPLIVGSKQLNYILVKHISIHPDRSVREASFEDGWNSIHRVKASLQKN